MADVSMNLSPLRLSFLCYRCNVCRGKRTIGVPGALAEVDDVEEDADEMEIEEEEEEPVTVPDQKDETEVRIIDMLKQPANYCYYHLLGNVCIQKTDVLEGDSDDDEDDEVDEVKKIGPHPDASTTLIFVNRPSNRK